MKFKCKALTLPLGAKRSTEATEQGQELHDTAPRETGDGARDRTRVGNHVPSSDEAKSLRNTSRILQCRESCPLTTARLREVESLSAFQPVKKNADSGDTKRVTTYTTNQGHKRDKLRIPY